MNRNDSPVGPSPAGSDVRTITVHSLLAGLAPLLPVPLLDDWILDRVRRRLVERLAGEAGLDLRQAAEGERRNERLRLLADKDPSEWDAGSCVGGCLHRAVVVPMRFVLLRVVRKLLRKIFYFLAVKDAVDELSRTFQHAWLVRHAFARGHLPTTTQHARELRAAVDAVAEEMDPRPLESAARSSLRHSRRLFRRAGRILARTLRGLSDRDGDALEWVDEAAEETDEQAAGLVDELLAGFLHERGYLSALEEHLDRRLDDSSNRSHAPAT